MIYETYEPTVFKEALRDEKWRIVIYKEIASTFKKNDTWKLIPRLSGKKPIGFKCIYKEKNNAKKEIERYNAKLVVKGYS